MQNINKNKRIISKECLNNKDILLFEKKVSINDKIIPLKSFNDLGNVRHYPPANKE